MPAVWRKGFIHPEIWHWIFSNTHYSSAAPEHQSLHWCSSPTSALMQALLWSSSPPPSAHQQILIWLALIWLQFTLNSLWCCLYLPVPSKCPQLKPSPRLVANLCHWNLGISTQGCFDTEAPGTICKLQYSSFRGVFLFCFLIAFI